MNIRPFRDMLRAKYSTGFIKDYDSHSGGCRVVALSQLFPAGKDLPNLTYAHKGDRWVTIQLWDDGRHRVEHAMVTQDGPTTMKGPQHLHWSTIPTDFTDPVGMIDAINTELTRTDHTRP